MMGELKFFLGFQVRQLAKGTFIAQEKYVRDMLKKFDMTNASPMKTPMPIKGKLGSCDGDSSDDTRAAAKRGRNESPPGCRTSTRMTSKAAPSSGPASSTGGRTKSTWKKRKGKDTVPDSDLVEKVPTYNVGMVHIVDWRRLGEKNPYRFEERTYNIGDREFWTNTQMNIWDDFYNCPELMRNGVIVQPKAINKEELAMLQATQYRFMVDTLQKMGLFDLVCLKPGRVGMQGRGEGH
ncbi:hypothetical protein QYE76_050863 [Lolium multiflorum]|uniref:Reverse transcriptase Ty1/copia-type domain-containing protein n=1 Tax=Lolium multiflorum TaxID=4521 RepID=A0AAD8SRN1_LOLMU|nr:hypothetical protein QYE76_050863 [Lolium multiflorum]